jgi:hypothetical protein
VYHRLYSEAVVSSVASAVALVEVGRFREAVEYVQKAAKTLYEAARDVFEHVRVTAQRLVKLFVEAVTSALAWIDEHKAYLFLMAAATAGAVALSAALNLWGLVELEKLAYAASLTPFIPAGVKEHLREETLRILREAPDPYEKFKEIAKAAITKNEKLPQPWESLRMLIAPKPSEERRLMMGKTYSKLDEGRKKALFYATLALEETFGVCRSVLREAAAKKAVQRVEVGEEPFKRVVHVADVGRLIQLAEEEGKAFENALKILRERLNEYAVKYGLRDLLDVNEDVARRLAEAKAPELSEFKDVSFGMKAYAALVAYREYALGRRGAFDAAAWYWLEVGGSAWLLYHAPKTAYNRAKKAGVERPAAVEELVAEALRRLFLKPGADRHRGFVEELARGGRLALELVEEKTKKKTESYVFRLFKLEEGGELKELGIKLRISKVGEGEGITYTLELNASWREFFAQKLEARMKAAVEVGERLPVEDRFPYMGGWVDSDVAIARNKEGKRMSQMSTSHLWQLAETHALFDWSYVTVSNVNLTLEGPKPQSRAKTSLEKLDEAIKWSADGGWLKMLGVRVKSWEGLKRWVSDHWDEVISMAKRRLEGVKVGSGFDLAGALKELEGLKNELDDDNIAREVVAPALLLLQAERLGVNETMLRYLGAVISGAIGGDGHVSAAMGVVGLTSGERGIALLWGAVLAAYGIEAEVRRVGSAFQVIVSGDDAARLAGLYFRYGSPLLEGDDRLKNHRLAEAMKLAAEGLDIRWEGLRRTEGGLVAADLIISEGDVTVKYNIYLRGDAIELEFHSSDRGRVELAARLLRIVGVSAKVKKKGSMDIWRVVATTDKLAAGREELRKALAEIVEKARGNGWVDAGKAERWLEKLESGRVLKEGWPKYHVGLSGGGALDVRFVSTNPDSIQQVARRLNEIGLVEGIHFTMKMSEGDRDGYVSILREGLAYAAWLSVHGSGERQRLAVEFVEYILQRAREEGDAVYEKAKEIVKEGKERGSLRLEGFEGRVEVGGSEYVVKVTGWGAEIEKKQDDKKLLRLKITAEVGRVEGEHTIVDRVVREYTITFGRYGNNAARGFAYASAKTPGGREADAERFAAVVKALTGEEPWVYQRSDGRIMMECYEGHLKGFARYAELAGTIKKWLDETGR